MPLWFARGLRRGVVTTRYPARSDPSAASLPTPPAFRPRQLTLRTVDQMIAACPGTALNRVAETLVFDVGACTACGRCARVAPHAVAPSGEFELASTARSALIKLIPIIGDER
jgi:formate hydrogenlyase subunit 6/NADH:ubiquinone oxidoreductase subunit I